LPNTTINPWTGRRLRKKVRSGLDSDCKVYRRQKKSPLAAKVLLRWRDSSQDWHDVWMERAALMSRGHGWPTVVPEPKVLVGRPGAYWTVYASAGDPTSVVKVRPAFTVADATTIDAEERVYRLAEQYGVGPVVRDWFMLHGSRRAPAQSGVLRDSGKGDRLTEGIAVAVVERYQQEVDGRVRRMKSFARMEAELMRRVDRMEKETGIRNREPWQDRNMLADLTGNGGDVVRLTVGDWGSFTHRK
jgi:hypothetical protein